ncbi:nucleotidyltransferase domain-containing protein [Nodosilinea sp. LEGE 07298]|uniref:nucleotidyltransferase family protein n=1 Tax=Nodosilinea sp. LEGE 07298 TaxID=2777970 RepID=UPI0018803A5A|nr:nucleotidyltransferase domain-containing protein [Nodosilinea sp. LEGE 07298]MBE9111856.1 nucleotidyltransferase domain-containing protein [Nodosilinea sp. LEGE 07298]
MDLANTIALTPQQRQIILALVQKHLPDTTVWAYGSRVRGTARPHSDLDLVAFATPQQQGTIADLQEALDESDLPFRVDLLGWHELPEQFHQTIATDYAVVQQGLGCDCQTAVPL